MRNYFLNGREILIESGYSVLDKMSARSSTTVKTILEAASTGEVGDGKIVVSDVLECYRIRTGEKGKETLR